MENSYVYMNILNICAVFLEKCYNKAHKSGYAPNGAFHALKG